MYVCVLKHLGFIFRLLITYVIGSLSKTLSQGTALFHSGIYRGTLEGKRHRPEYDELLLDPLLKYSGLYESGGIRGDLAASLQVWAGGRPLALPVHTAYKHFTSRWK